MAKKKKMNVSKSLISAIAFVVIGVLFCILRSGSIGILLTIAGVLFIAMGVLAILRKELVEGIINVAIGAAIIICGWVIAELALLILGILLIVKGVLDLLPLVKHKAGFKAMIAPLAAIVLGILLVVAKWVVADWFFIVLGVVFIVRGVLDLLSLRRK